MLRSRSRDHSSLVSRRGTSPQGQRLNFSDITPSAAFSAVDRSAIERSPRRVSFVNSSLARSGSADIRPPKTKWPAGCYACYNASALEREITSLRNRLSSAEDRSIVQRDEDMESLAQVIHERDAVVAELEKALETLAEMRKGRDSERDANENRIRALEADRDRYKSDFVTLRQDYTKACQAADAFEAHSSSLSKHLTTVTEEMERQRRALAEAELTNERLRLQLGRTEVERDTEKRDNIRLSDRTKELKKMTEQLEDDRRAAETSLECARQRMTLVDKFERVMLAKAASPAVRSKSPLTTEANADVRKRSPQRTRSPHFFSSRAERGEASPTRDYSPQRTRSPHLFSGRGEASPTGGYSGIAAPTRTSGSELQGQGGAYGGGASSRVETGMRSSSPRPPPGPGGKVGDLVNRSTDLRFAYECASPAEVGGRSKVDWVNSSIRGGLLSKYYLQ